MPDVSFAMLAPSAVIGPGTSFIDQGPSNFSLIAALFYLVVMACAVMAGRRAATMADTRRHIYFWHAVAGIFCILALARIWMAEDLLRDLMRMWLIQDIGYAYRRHYQWPLALLVFAMGLAGAGLWARHWRRRRGDRGGRMILLAIAGLGWMMALILLRLISLHTIDGLLYGTLHLNWWMDMGAGGLVAAAALGYCKARRR